VLAAPLLAILFAASANAQATRTWVSGVGDDANPCSRTAPCKTFAGAISKTSAAGEIDVLDPGGFGAVTITKSISIINDGVGEAGVLVSGTNGIVVAAGPTDVVTLRGLFIDGIGPGAGSLAGVQFSSGGTLNVERCRIFEFQGASGAGINFQPSGASYLTVLDTEIFDNGTAGTTLGGILIQPQSGGSATVLLDRVSVLNNQNFGIRIDGTVSGAGASTVTIRNSVASANGGLGIQALSVSPAISVMVDTTTVANNTTFGVRAQGSAATVRLTNSTVTGNGTGLGASASGTLASYSNNNVSGNSTDGAPTTTITAK
jgi:hypothetical protein